MARDDELDLLSRDIGAWLPDAEVTLQMRTLGVDDATGKSAVVGTRSVVVRAIVEARRPAAGDVGGSRVGPVAGGAEVVERLEVTVEAAHAAAGGVGGLWSIGGVPDSRTTPRRGDLVVFGGVAWAVVAVHVENDGRLWVIHAEGKST
jgi:hypothetical protein